MNMTFLKMEGNERTKLMLLLTAILVAVSTLTRVALLIKSSSEVDFTMLNLAGIFLIGWFYDLLNALYFTLPLAIYLWLLPERIFSKPGHRFMVYGFFLIATGILLFNAVSEWFFWDEFGTRFNFIAVDYLVYTTEVIGNIQQSYPIGWILIGIVILSIGILYVLKESIDVRNSVYKPFKSRTKTMAAHSLLVLLSFFLISTKQHHFSYNAFANELAGNGMYELFAAYRNNELDYARFYQGMDTEHANLMVHELIKTPEAEFTNTNPESIERTIVNTAPEKKLNVVLINVESFSADFMQLFGNKENITPYLDSLAQHSLVFTHLYATGTRTVRGLEALSLCVPPTPGQSIVRRPNNEDLFSLGKVFNQKGYVSKYIYGGYGYFDNMNYFFGHNGYKVVDRVALNNEEIDYENIWGVADENLFDLALHEIDESARTKPVFAHIMTTSNHRPYTYPDGRIDIPSHTSREGAVKYTDYAIGNFIRQASGKLWFKNTVFVIIADHCASSAGKAEIPVDKYHIPMLIFSPGNIEVGTMDRLMSQIDVGPTLLGLLNFSYTSNFFGYDMYKLEQGRERAFISTYQNLGFLKTDKLVVLSPQLKVDTYAVNADHEQKRTHESQSLTNEAIAWYQMASYSFQKGLMK